MEQEPIHPRGREVMLPHGGLPEVIPPYLQKLIAATGGPDGPIGLQYMAQVEAERQHFEGEASDPLLEDLNEAAPGLIYKYPGRALWTITRNCAAYCRFCTRGRMVGVPSPTPLLSDGQIEKTLDFIAKEPGLNEIILSGGDPLTIRPDKLCSVLGRLRQLQDGGKLDIVRIGTRVPLQNPITIKEVHYRAISQLRKPYMMVHINHPAEMTDEALFVLDNFRRQGDASVLSQTVLLKGVNDNVETLSALFNKVAKEGIRPYYLYQNDPVYWAEHFTVPIGEAIDIWQQLRPRLSGLAATARFVIDTPGGYGKIPLPEGGAWQVDYDAGFRDFKGIRFSLF